MAAPVRRAVQRLVSVALRPRTIRTSACVAKLEGPLPRKEGTYWPGLEPIGKPAWHGIDRTTQERGAAEESVYFLREDARLLGELLEKAKHQADELDRRAGQVVREQELDVVKDIVSRYDLSFLEELAHKKPPKLDAADDEVQEKDPLDPQKERELASLKVLFIKYGITDKELDDILKWRASIEPIDTIGD
ncbi:hypothetical protein WJX72_001694 [[Myrmecia] bisecta]|uniref:Uncharacterized protein n=1 Tax=[Myrmecia] bisecta TaxID=41462 RepID=A0AAW1R4Z5_9CHLO